MKSKILGKQIIFVFAAFSILIQIVFLFAAKNSFSATIISTGVNMQTKVAGNILTSTAQINGNESLEGIVSPTEVSTTSGIKALSAVYFYLEDPANGNIITISTTKNPYNTPPSWYGSLYNTSLENKTYNLQGKAYFGTDQSYVYETPKFQLQVNKLTVNFVEDYSLNAISGNKTIYIDTSKDISLGLGDALTLSVNSSSGTYVESIQATKDTSQTNRYYFTWNVSAYANGTYSLKVMAYKMGGEMAEKTINVTVNNTPTISMKAHVQDVISAGTVVSGTKNLVVSSEPWGYNFTGVGGVIKKNGIYVSNIYLTQYTNDWKGSLDSTTLANGDNYTFCATGYYASIPYEGCSLSFNINNTSTAASVFPSVENATGSYKKLKVTTSGATIYGVTGKIRKDSSTGTVAKEGLILLYNSTLNQWAYEYDTASLTSSGSYVFCAIASLDASGLNKTAETCSSTFTPSTITTPTFTLSTQVSDIPGMPTSKLLKVWATSAPQGHNLTSAMGKIIDSTGYTTNGSPFNLTYETAGYWSYEYNASSLQDGSYFFCAKGFYNTNEIPWTCSTASFNIYNTSSNGNNSNSNVSIYPDAMNSTGTFKTLQVTVLPSSTILYNVKGKIRKDGAYGVIAHDGIILSFDPYSSSWRKEFDTANFTSAGNFVFCATASLDSAGSYAMPEVCTGTFSVNTSSTTSESSASSDTQSSTPFKITFTDNFQPPLVGDKTITISANKTIDTCKFNIEGGTFAQFNGNINSMQCSTLLHTANFSDGNYTIRVVASNGSETKEIVLYTYFSNLPGQTGTPAPTQALSPTPTQSLPADSYIPQECKDKGYTTPATCQNYMMFPPECRSQNILDPETCKSYMYKYGMPPECQSQGVQTPEECQKIILANSMPQECKNSGATTVEECDKIMNSTFMLTPECKAANIITADECEKYMMEKFLPPECQNVSSQEECNFALRNAYNSSLPFLQTNSVFDALQSPTGSFPPECVSANITSKEECKNYMMKTLMPPECREANATTKEECEKVMFKKYGPKECIEAQVFEQSECEKFMFKKYAPEDCKQAGIFNPEACKKYMYEKYNGKENIPIEKFPIECQKANVTSADECDKIMKKAYMPKDCKDKGIEDEEKCGEYLQKKYMPKECQDAGASDSKECDKVMFKKYAPKECLKAGIENEDECQKYMFNLYAPKVKCDNIEDWQCKKNLEDKHLGNVVAKQVQFSQIKESSTDMIGKALKIKELQKIEGFENSGAIPLSDSDASLRIVKTSEDMVLNDEDSLIQTGPVAFMVDSDNDALSDDIEKLLGTDPNNTDTDNDGYSDGEEMKTGHNPLGSGLYEGSLSPTEKAIIDNKVLEHPKTSGEISDSLTVEKVENLEKEDGYILSGKSESSDIVTVYIYSDLPLVLTVKANEEGKWEYKLDKRLSDGEHEVYVVVNDDTGKVVSKSKPSSLFVKEAKAVSANEFIDDSMEAIAEKTPAEISSDKYDWIMLLSIIIGLSLFGIILILRKRKNKVQK